MGSRIPCKDLFIIIINIFWATRTRVPRLMVWSWPFPRGRTRSGDRGKLCRQEASDYRFKFFKPEKGLWGRFAIGVSGNRSCPRPSFWTLSHLFRHAAAARASFPGRAVVWDVAVHISCACAILCVVSALPVPPSLPPPRWRVDATKETHMRGSQRTQISGFRRQPWFMWFSLVDADPERTICIGKHRYVNLTQIAHGRKRREVSTFAYTGKPKSHYNLIISARRIQNNHGGSYIYNLLFCL